MRWKEEFEQVEQRIQRNLDKLREINERIGDVIQSTNSRRTGTNKRIAQQ